MASDTTNQVEVWPHLHVLRLALQSSLLWTEWEKHKWTRVWFPYHSFGVWESDQTKTFNKDI